MAIFKVKTSSAESRIALLFFLSAFGKSWNDAWSPHEVEKQYPWSKHPTISFNTETKYLDAYEAKSGYDLQWPADADKVYRLLDDLEIEVKNVGNGHTARVTKEGIKLGCGTISFDKFYELGVAVERIRAYEQAKEKV